MAPRGVHHDMPGNRVNQPGMHVRCRKGHALDADEILERQLSFRDLRDQLTGAVGIAAESVRDYRRQVSCEFHIGQQRQQVRIALVQPLGHVTVQSRSPARDHGSKDWATRVDDATGFTERLDPVGAEPASGCPSA
jgi:hypothetical protein